MTHPGTADVIRRFNDAFVQRDPDMLADLVADDCVMESTQPAPNGTRYEGYDACLRLWQGLIDDPNGSFEPEDVVVSVDRATIRSRYRFGEGDENSVRGVQPHARPRREDRRGARLREGWPSTVRPRGVPSRGLRAR